MALNITAVFVHVHLVVSAHAIFFLPLLSIFGEKEMASTVHFLKYK